MELTKEGLEAAFAKALAEEKQARATRNELSEQMNRARHKLRGYEWMAEKFYGVQVPGKAGVIDADKRQLPKNPAQKNEAAPLPYAKLREAHQTTQREYQELNARCELVEEKLERREDIRGLIDLAQGLFALKLKEEP